MGLAGILAIAIYVWADGALEASGRQAELPATAAPMARSGELGNAPAAPSLPAQPTDASGPSAATPQPAAAGGPAVTPAPQARGQPTAAASVTPTPAPTPNPTPTPLPLPTTVVIEGSGSQVTEPFAYPGGSVRVRSVASASGAGCYYIGTFSAGDPALLPADASLRTTVLFLEGAGSAEGWVDLALAPGSYYLEIESDCDWTVTVAPA